MQLLETVEVRSDAALEGFRLPVQYVNRPNLDFRGFCGTIAAGEIRPGDEVLALPSGRHSKVKAVVAYEGELAAAGAGEAITLTLEDEIDVSRGDMLVRADQPPPAVASSLDAHLVWMQDAPLRAGKEYGFKLAGKFVTGRVEAILHQVDVNTLEQKPAEALHLNEIALCRISLNAPAVMTLTPPVAAPAASS